MRDKLIELMNNVMLTRKKDGLLHGEAKLTFGEIADHLLAHGVPMENNDFCSCGERRTE